MTLKNYKTKFGTTIIASLIIGLIMLSPMTVLPNVSGQVKMPANAVSTTNGGWVTPLKTVDDKGNPLIIHYEVGQPVPVDKALPCPPGAQSGLQQEGGAWTYPVKNANAIGLKVTWTMPTGSVTPSTNGLYYNPVNFDYTGTTSGSTPYIFFQVDWGTGGGGVQDNWSYAMWYKNSDNTWHTPPTRNILTAVPSTQGSQYTVQTALEPYPMSSTDSYVVQISKGTQSWLYSTALGYTPQLGKIDNLKSYQDEYVTVSGTTTLSSDTVTSPIITTDQSNSIGFDSNAITGVTTKNAVAGGVTSSYPILSSSVSGKTVTDSVPCSSW